MPLTAIVHGKKLIAPRLSNEDWESVKKTEIRMECCGSIGHARTSVKGLRHFYHEKNAECPYQNKGETEEHRNIKYAIFQICEKLGWTSEIERKSGNWIADVYAEKENNRVVFEVQLSPQTFDVTKSRTKTYKNEGIRCYWLFGKLPNTINGSSNIQMFEIRVNDGEPRCNINGDIIDLSTFVEKALLNQITAPILSPKKIKNDDSLSDIGVGGISSNTRIDLSSSFTAIEYQNNKETEPNKLIYAREDFDHKAKMAPRPSKTPIPVINLSEKEKLKTQGILEFNPEEMKHIDNEHISYDSRSWDIIGSYSTLDEASIKRNKAWSYYHCTYIIVDRETFTVLANDQKEYIEQPGLNALRNSQ